jgi:hypothetical protein
LEADYQDSMNQINEMQTELRKKTERLSLIENEKKELQNKLQQQDYEFKNMKITEAEKNSEMSVFRIRKEKLVAERVRILIFFTFRM